MDGCLNASHVYLSLHEVCMSAGTVTQLHHESNNDIAWFLVLGTRLPVCHLGQLKHHRDSLNNHKKLHVLSYVWRRLHVVYCCCMTKCWKCHGMGSMLADENKIFQQPQAHSREHFPPPKRCLLWWVVDGSG